MTTALIVVDVQNDFCEGGSLAVTGGSQVANNIASFTGRNLEKVDGWGIDYVVATRDRHIDPGEHFSDTPDFIDSWPRHCVHGTAGADLHPAVARLPFHAIFDKGAYSAAYSGFEGTLGGTEDGETLHDWLNRHGIGQVQVCGLATDYCVRATALTPRARLPHHRAGRPVGTGERRSRRRLSRNCRTGRCWSPSDPVALLGGQRCRPPVRPAIVPPSARGATGSAPARTVHHRANRMGRIW